MRTASAYCLTCCFK